jgi:hypothetical protein
LPCRLEVSADRQRCIGRQDCIHDLLAIFRQQQDVRAGKLLCHDGFGQLRERENWHQGVIEIVRHTAG